METTTAGVVQTIPSRTKELKGTEKRDALVAIEKKYQARWEETGVFELDAPSTSEVPFDSISAEELRKRHPKFFGTTAYPYMNGTLHIGHAFTYTKIEFDIGFQRMLGKRALWPQGYHCTGLPIKASADKLVKEVKMFGRDFENYKEDTAAPEETTKAPAAPAGPKEDVTKFAAKKTKAATKTVRATYQFQIMLSMGIPIQEIHLFSDAQYWLEFFPPLCRRDFTNLGCRIDWRRQFVTTDANPYYDAFVRWQMIRLKELKKIKFGKRYTIYSPQDGQPCMDHDRSEGEGVGPQEYTVMKLRVLEWAENAKAELAAKLPSGVNIYLVPATLRPETMYGQTCCFVGPALVYGVFKANDKDFFVMTDRAARNMAFQGIFHKEGVIEKVAEIKGADMVGTLVYAPLSIHKDGVRVLPMESVLPTKGTGVVTSVPSDSPDDYAIVTELAKKADYYKIKKEWAEFEIPPIISTPSYGDLAAPFLVKKLKINSSKDPKLAEAKELAYKEGYYQGTMKVGKWAGEKVETAKPKVRQELIDAGEAFAYAEPEGQVRSRSGDICVVALMDQWYLDYGEAKWKEQAIEYVENKDGKGLNTYSHEAQHAFLGVLNWLNQWALSRTYGLGTKIPWDPQSLVESLSDSTIYMAYYTICHLLHKDLFGREKGPANVEASQMTDEVWDYVFCLSDKLSEDVLVSSKIPQKTLEAFRREFEYWYPLDIRVSGKDLIGNHLTFMIYNHIALWPQEYWPRSIRVNGFLMINGEKMSKSTGNFMTLAEVTRKYGADATRLALADGGDGIGDANFEEDVADSSVLRLYNQKEWCEEVARGADNLRTGALNSFQDALFNNEMNVLVREAKKHYEDTSYKLALKASFYDFATARDFYREACAAAGIKMHRELIFRYMELQALALAVIAPHWSDFVWTEILKKPSSIQLARWPEVPAGEPGLTAARDYVRTVSSSANSAEGAQLKKKAKGKEASFDTAKPKKLTVFVASKFPAWQSQYIDLLREVWDPSTNRAKIDDKELNTRVAKMGGAGGKRAMPFVQTLKRRLQSGEQASAVLDRQLPFDEGAILVAMVPGLKRTAGLVAAEIFAVEEGSKTGRDLTNDGREVAITAPQAENAVPMQPTFLFENV